MFATLFAIVTSTHLLSKVILVSALDNIDETCQIYKAGDCNRCNNIGSFRILQMNAWGLTYFKDLPVPSADEPYNVTAIVEAIRIKANSLPPNPFLEILNQPISSLQTLLVSALNSAAKKEIRLRALCDYLNLMKFDFVFLQEVWFLKDYSFLAECTRPYYRISSYDSQYCGKPKGMVPLNCSGLVTLSMHQLENQRYIDYNMGNASAETIFALYLTHFTQKKVMFVDANVKGCKVRLINTHTSPAYNTTSQSRDIRISQVKQLIGGVGCDFDIAILGADLNDSPIFSYVPQPYGHLIESGFEDVANPGWKYENRNYKEFSTLSFFPTYSNPGNTWSGDTSPNYFSQTIDYIMTKGTKYYKHRSFVDIQEFKVLDLKANGIFNYSLSDHSAVFAKVIPRCALNKFFF